MRRTFSIVAFFMLMLVMSFHNGLQGQAGLYDFAFMADVSNTVNVVEIFPDGKIFVGGTFTTCNMTPVQRMVRLYPDGSNDLSYATFALQGGADGPVRSSVMQTDGRVLVGGLFNNVNGHPRKNIARLDTNGAVDPTFVVGTGANNEVTHISTNGSRIVLTGFFNSYNGSPAPGIVVLNMDGSIDTTFTLPSVWTSISATVMMPNHKLYLVGGFTTYLGTPVNRIVRLNANGTIDTTFNAGAGLNALVHTLAVQPDGKVLLGGAFQIAQGLSRNRLVRFNADGSLDTTFHPGLGASSGVRAIALEPGGKIFIGGDFTTYNGITVNRIARLLPDGTLDTAYHSMPGTNGTVNALRVQTDGKLMVGGGFSQIIGVTPGKIARLTTDVCSIDTIAPVPLVPTLPTINGICEATVTTIPTANDNCAGLITATPMDPLHYNTPGTHQIHWIFDDGNGNTTSQYQQVIIGGVPVAVSVDTLNPGSSYELIANHTAAGVSYQWLDCLNGFLPLQGETLQHFIPQQSGSYAVIISEAGCSDTSACITVTITTIGVFKVPGYNTLHVYPNPTAGWLNLTLSKSEHTKTITLTDLQGRVVMQPFSTQNRTTSLDLHSLKAGVYLLTVHQGDQVFVQKVIRQP